MIITQKSVFARPANETLRGDIKRVRRNHSLLRPHCCNAYVRTVCKVNKISPALLLSEAQTKGFNVRKGRSDPPQAYIFGTNLRNGWIRNGREMRIDAIGLGSGLAPIDLASSWNLWYDSAIPTTPSCLQLYCGSNKAQVTSVQHRMNSIT